MPNTPDPQAAKAEALLLRFAAEAHRRKWSYDRGLDDDGVPVKSEAFDALHRLGEEMRTALEELRRAPAVLPSVVVPADRATLRHRIAEAMREHYLCTNREEADADGNLPCRCGDWREPGAEVDDENDWDAHLAAVALTALPAPTDRAAVLNAAAQHLYTALFPAVYDDMGQKAAEGVQRAVSELRRLAAVPSAAETANRAALRDRIAALFRNPPGAARLGDATPGEIADAVLAVLPAQTDRAAEAERPLSPDYEHPECGFHWHGRDDMDIPMRDGQPVCPRCELAAVEKQLHYSEKRREELRQESRRRGKLKGEYAERIRQLEIQLDEVRSQLGAEILRAGQAEAELRRVAAEEQPTETQWPGERCGLCPPGTRTRHVEDHMVQVHGARPTARPAETQDGDRVKAIADAIGPVMLLGLQDAELFDEPGQERIRDWIKWISETVAALPAPELVDRAAVLEEAAQIAVAENQSCPAVYQCQPCLTRERIAADLLRAAAKERPAVGEQPDTQTRERVRCVVGCSSRSFRRDHAPHDWEPQPGLTVHCPGYPQPAP